MGRFILALLLSPLLAACSLTNFMDQDITDYFRTNDLAANRIILLNVLRAKDGAPLHFSELSQVRGQLSIGLSDGLTFPWGPQSHVVNIRNGASISTNLSSSPSFDIASLDTQDFTKGVMTTISPQTFKFFLDEGEDYRMVLMLLASGIRRGNNAETLLNAPDSTRVVCYPDYSDTNRPPENTMPDRYTVLAGTETCNGFKELEFFGFLRILNNVGRLYAVEHVQRKPVGDPFVFEPGRDLRAVSNLDPKKYRLQKVGSTGKVQLMQAGSTSVVLCQEAKQGGVPQAISTLGDETGSADDAGPDACVAGSTPESVVTVPVRSAGTSRVPANVVPVGTLAAGKVNEKLAVTLRSTLAVIQYVGRILSFQEMQTKEAANGVERCVTIEYERLTGATCEGGGPFRLQHDSSATGIGLYYDGDYWAVPQSKSCPELKGCDFSMQTMATIALLLNLNKSAKDIASTPAFEAVP